MAYLDDLDKIREQESIYDDIAYKIKVINEEYGKSKYWSTTNKDGDEVSNGETTFRNAAFRITEAFNEVSAKEDDIATYSWGHDRYTLTIEHKGKIVFQHDTGKKTIYKPGQWEKAFNALYAPALEIQLKESAEESKNQHVERLAAQKAADRREKKSLNRLELGL